MFRFLKIALSAAAVAAVCARFGRARSAQSWPTQRVTIVVPFGAGSVTDILARIFADEMGKNWGQQVVVENQPGLAGTAARRQGRAGRPHADGHLQRPHRRRTWSARTRRSMR